MPVPDTARVPVAATAPTISAAAAAVDCLFLTVSVALSLALYVGHLGFYYDDYGLLQRMGIARHGSLLGLYHAVSPGTGQRPVQAFTYALLYWLFGSHPLGWHVFNAVVFAAAVLLLYLVLRELRQPRLVAVALPLVYAMLPHYATDRFWAAAFEANTSTAFYALSLYAGLRALRGRPAAVAGWLAVAALAILGSLFAYELVAPLFALNLMLIWYAWRTTQWAERARRLRLQIVLGTVAAAFVAVTVLKTTLVVGRSEGGYRIGSFEGGLLHHLAYLVSGVIKLNVATYLVALPYVLWWILDHDFSASILAVGALTGLLAFGYLLRIGRGDSVSLGGEPRRWREILGVGLVAFVLGYAIFLTNGEVLFRSAGIDNRVNAAAALGVAGVFVGVIGWLATKVAPRRRVAVFAGAIASAVAVGVFVVDSLSSYWTSAYKHQHAIVAGLTQELGSDPGDATVVLDGSCPEIGPAVVFGNQHDLTGALWLRYRDSGLHADIATPNLQATSRGLKINFSFLGHASSRTYMYGRGLVVYNRRTRQLARLRNRQQALQYLATARPAFSCPPPRSFAWGFDISRWSPFV